MADPPGEFDLIERIRRRVVGRDDVVLGIGDDAALLQVPGGMQLVVAMDTLNAGVHFPPDTQPADIGWKALAVNLSDLAAMGAQPAWCTLALSMPAPDAAWLDAFIDGFAELAALHRVALVGGDTTRGPLSICVTVHGFVEPGRALRRDGARVGDDVWVSGTLGDAAAALALLGYGAIPAPESVAATEREALRRRLDRPTPRVALGQRLLGIASACIDVSDGLLADIAHVAEASAVAAVLDVDRLPASDALMRAFAGDAGCALRAAGGDDYELCFCAPEKSRTSIEASASEVGIGVTRVGRIEAGAGVIPRVEGRAWTPPRLGFEHFRAD